jgi:putative sigma-54 modulation protein
MTIKILISSIDMELTPHLREYIEKKLGKMERFLGTIEEARVELKYDHGVRNDNDRYIVQYTVSGKNLLLRAEERSADIFASVDTALDKLHRQIEKYKGKHYHSRPGGLEEPEVYSVGTPSSDLSTEPTGTIVRRKKFLLEPMSEKQAVEQMQLLGHEEFFLFQNSQNGTINLLYRRRDGSYGILEPEIR